MYIEPNTTIILLQGVPMDNTYTDTVLFNNADEQYNELMAYFGVRLERQTYQRVQKGKIRAQQKADGIYGYNYLMFKNTNYGNKWFYAFILNVEYINDSVSEITFEIDVLQTWMFNYTLGTSYVEREHSSTDNIGENLAPEPVDIGTIKCNSIETTSNFTQFSLLIAHAKTGAS